MQESDRSSDTKLRCNWWMTASDLVGGSTCSTYLSAIFAYRQG